MGKTYGIRVYANNTPEALFLRGMRKLYRGDPGLRLICLKLLNLQENIEDSKRHWNKKIKTMQKNRARRAREEKKLIDSIREI
jgi:hypothetical protein